MTITLALTLRSERNIFSRYIFSRVRVKFAIIMYHGQIQKSPNSVLSFTSFPYRISKGTEYLIDVLRKELNFKLCSVGTDKSLKITTQFTPARYSRVLFLPLNFGDNSIQNAVQRKDGQGSPSYG